jgi:hypothetical protein
MSSLVIDFFANLILLINSSDRAASCIISFGSANVTTCKLKTEVDTGIVLEFMMLAVMRFDAQRNRLQVALAGCVLLKVALRENEIAVEVRDSEIRELKTILHNHISKFQSTNLALATYKEVRYCVFIQLVTPNYSF